MLTKDEEKIFESVKPIVKELKELAQSLSCEIPTSQGRDPRGCGETIDEEYADILRKYVDRGQIEKFGISVYDNAGIIIVKFPNIDVKLRYVVRLTGDRWWE